MSCITLEVVLFFLDQEINTVQSNTTVDAYDTSASVCIRKSCDDLVVTGFLHLRCVDVEYSLVMCFMIFCKDLFQSFIRLITVSCTSLYCHVDTTVRHKRSLKRFVCLKSDNFLQVFHALVDISRAVCCKTGYNFCLHVKNAAFCTFLFLQLLKSSPQFICCLCRSFQE